MGCVLVAVSAGPGAAARAVQPPGVLRPRRAAHQLRRLGPGPPHRRRAHRHRPRRRPQRQLARFDPSSLPTPRGGRHAEAREEQRRLITTFALELAAVGSRRHAAAAARLVEWACPYVRAHTPQNDFDRAWQLAALSVLEGGIDSTGLHDHLDHVHALFPDEPRAACSRAASPRSSSARRPRC